MGLYAKTAGDHVLTLIPFEGGRALTWDVAVVCTTADSYIDLAVQDMEVRIQSERLLDEQLDPRAHSDIDYGLSISD